MPTGGRSALYAKLSGKFKDHKVPAQLILNQLPPRTSRHPDWKAQVSLRFAPGNGRFRARTADRLLGGMTHDDGGNGVEALGQAEFVRDSRTV